METKNKNMWGALKHVTKIQHGHCYGGCEIKYVGGRQKGNSMGGWGLAKFSILPQLSGSQMDMLRYNWTDVPRMLEINERCVYHLYELGRLLWISVRICSIQGSSGHLADNNHQIFSPSFKQPQNKCNFSVWISELWTKGHSYNAPPKTFLTKSTWLWILNLEFESKFKLKFRDTYHDDYKIRHKKWSMHDMAATFQFSKCLLG